VPEARYERTSNGDKDESWQEDIDRCGQRPGAPSRRYPIKVVVVKTGPGVTCPTATAVADFYGPDHYGSIGGVVGMFVTAARMLAPVGAGAMSVALGGYAPVLWTLAFGSALAAVAMFMAQRIVPPRRSEPDMNGGH
jgi:hypothetical protein